MYSAAFIFEPGNYDEEFYTLDNQIHEIAASYKRISGQGIVAILRWKKDKCHLLLAKSCCFAGIFKAS